MPVLVCLTFGDKLYAERISEKGVHLPKQDMIAVVKDQLSVSEPCIAMVTYMQQFHVIQGFVTFTFISQGLAMSIMCVWAFA